MCRQGSTDSHRDPLESQWLVPVPPPPCMAAKFFTGLPLDGPDPECVQGDGGAGAGRGAIDPSREPGPLEKLTRRVTSR